MHSADEQAARNGQDVQGARDAAASHGRVARKGHQTAPEAHVRARLAAQEEVDRGRQGLAPSRPAACQAGAHPGARDAIRTHREAGQPGEADVREAGARELAQLTQARERAQREQARGEQLQGEARRTRVHQQSSRTATATTSKNVIILLNTFRLD